MGNWAVRDMLDARYRISGLGIMKVQDIGCKLLRH